MAIDSSLVGRQTEPFQFEYDWKTVVLYALGVGAKRDELDYLYEARGPKVLPTFAVVPAYAPVWELLAASGGALERMVHLGQSVRLVSPLPASGRLQTTARVEAVYDLKRLAQVVCRCETRSEGTVVAETDWTLLFRDAGGFGGPPPPRGSVFKPGASDVPSWTHSDRTSSEQALLYRLSGDTNPLHADPELAARVGFDAGPILHGLSTIGFVARAAIRHACSGDADRLRFITAQFKKPVWPGDVIRTTAYDHDGKVVLTAHAADRPDAVVSACYAEIAD
jgi:acyl dehydratase